MSLSALPIQKGTRTATARRYGSMSFGTEMAATSCSTSPRGQSCSSAVVSRPRLTPTTADSLAARSMYMPPKCRSAEAAMTATPTINSSRPLQQHRNQCRNPQPHRKQQTPNKNCRSDSKNGQKVTKRNRTERYKSPPRLLAFRQVIHEQQQASNKNNRCVYVYLQVGARR